MLKGKSAIVTGSTSGIGWGIAQALAKEGVNIMLNGFTDDATVTKLKAEIAAIGVKVEYNGCDVTKPEQVDGMIDATVKAFGSLDIVINNAGIQFVAPIQDFPLEKWDAVIHTNLSSAFYTTRRAIPIMTKQKWGRIINISSAHGLVASEGKVAYVSAKHGIIGMTKVTALETSLTGITCNAICPGWVLTPLVQKQIEDNAKKKGISVDQAKAELVNEKQPTHEFVTPEEIGGLVIFLCSDAAKMITGSAYSIDGGWTAE